jgi:hypothetical protein
MGYSTEFSGTVYFENELTASQIAAINGIFNEDIRQHPEWVPLLDASDENTYLNYVALEFNKDFTGIEWDGSEKTNGMVEFLNLIRNYMESIGKPIVYKDSEMFAQGEEATDRWWVKVENNVARGVTITVTGRKVECPHCESEFLIDMEETDG